GKWGARNHEDIGLTRPRRFALEMQRPMCRRQQSNAWARMWRKPQSRRSLTRKRSYFNELSVGMVRSEGLEPPRFYSLPPQGSASTNSATSAWDKAGAMPGRINGADVTTEGYGDKARQAPDPEKYWPFLRRNQWRKFSVPGRAVWTPAPQRISAKLPAARRSRQHLLDLDCDPVAVDQHDAAGDRQVVGQHLDLVRLGGIELDDGAAG